MVKRTRKLDAYEQVIEDRYESLTPTPDKKYLLAQLQAIAKEYIQDKKTIMGVEEKMDAEITFE